jgi:hypothetical protein
VDDDGWSISSVHELGQLLCASPVIEVSYCQRHGTGVGMDDEEEEEEEDNDEEEEEEGEDNNNNRVYEISSSSISIGDNEGALSYSHPTHSREEGREGGGSSDSLPYRDRGLSSACWSTKQRQRHSKLARVIADWLAMLTTFEYI